MNEKVKSKRALIKSEFDHEFLKLNFGIEEIEMKNKISI